MSTGDAVKDGIGRALENLRAKLIDLTANNRLLNFKHGSGVSGSQSILRIIDELPNELWNRLVADKRLVFDPVPEPGHSELERYHRRNDALPGLETPDARDNKRPKDAAVWANWLWSDGSRHLDYNLPLALDGEELDGKFVDNRIQTLLYPDQLDARLRKIRSSAKLAMDESGFNLLFLAFGFLEWVDKPKGGPGESAKTYIAPLLLLPVEIHPETTGRGQRRYVLSSTGEEPQTNLSLCRKLEVEFDIPLPELKADETPESYFRRVQSAVGGQPDWRVRRYVSLALLTNLGKLLLYLDLDPANWPAGYKPAEHPIVREVLGAEGAAAPQDRDFVDTAEDEAKAAEIFDLKLPLVDKADPSQGKAIDAALRGRNLVIQGPPGTGKSQTITNLIAAALNEGKSVLFVAEKLAALQVVHRRLHEIGLSDFCLELHSHKTRKKTFFEDVAKRIGRKQRGNLSQYEITLNELRRKRDDLNAWSDAVRKPAGETGMTIADLLFEAGRQALIAPEAMAAAEALDLPETVVKSTRPLDLNGMERAETAAALARAVDRLAALDAAGGVAHHPWRGVGAGALAADDPNRTRRLLSAWRDLARVQPVATTRSGHPPEVGQALGGAQTAIAAGRDWPALHALASGAAEQLSELRTVFDLPLPPGGSGVKAATAVVRLAAAAPLDALAHVHPGLDAPGAADALTRLVERLDTRREMTLALEGRIAPEASASASPERLRGAARTLTETPWWRRLGGEWRTARATALEVSAAGASRAPEDQAQAMIDLAKLQVWDTVIAGDVDIRAACGPAFLGAETPIDQLIAARTWRGEVAERLSGTARRPLRNALLTLSAIDLKDIADYVDGELDRLMTEAGSGLDSDEEDLWTALCAQLDTPWRERMQKVDSPHAAETVCARMSEAVAADAEWECDTSALKASEARLSAQARTQLAEIETEAIEHMELDRAAWFSLADTVEGTIVRADEALAAQGALAGWMAYARARRQLTDAGALAVLGAVERGDLDRDLAVSAWSCSWAKAAAKTLLTANKTLRTWDGGQLADLRRRYAELDEQVMIYNRRRIEAGLMQRKPPLGYKGQYVRQHTEMVLLMQAASLQKKHPALRDTLDRAGRALQALKPCFMMGPLSVAQYLKPGKVTFDLVIMDEASQLRPEDAIGAVARGGQLVVVGDDMQLPPTSFFDRTMAVDDDGEEDEGPTVGQNESSILSLATSAFGGNQASSMLEWHYRSRHPELIAFSNHQFYKSQLKVVPAPSDATDDLGLTLIPVTKGWAIKGVNDVEARRVAEAAVRHLKTRPDRSLGVVAMNINQAERISEWIGKLSSQDTEAERVIDRGEDDAHRIEPFFVKNLENVQGDERDVIMISMTYGPREAGGSVPGFFGPINKEGGHRRLNVLFSRAKHQMVVFSSMRADDVKVGPESPEGARAMQAFLRFAETKVLPSGERLTGRAPDSPFEESVTAMLEREGYAVEPQYGVEGFRIDIAVCDPDAPGAYLLGIECDGVAYHSSLSARDRDRLRQEVLETAGWKIERIWSTDWFRDPAREMGRIVARLTALRASASRRRAAVEPAPALQVEIVSPSIVPDAKPLSIAEVDQGQRQPSIPRIVALTTEEKRAALVALRDRIDDAMPYADPERGLLRPRLLEELLKEGPTDDLEWLAVIPQHLRTATDAAQFSAYKEQVFEILA